MNYNTMTTDSLLESYKAIKKELESRCRTLMTILDDPELEEPEDDMPLYSIPASRIECVGFETLESAAAFREGLEDGIVCGVDVPDPGMYEYLVSAAGLDAERFPYIVWWVVAEEEG